MLKTQNCGELHKEHAGKKITLMNQKWYKIIYKYHTHIWWLLAPSVIIHALIAILHRLAGG